MSVVVYLTAATICFANACHPALVGERTPVGLFPLVHIATDQPGYGGDVLAFAQDNTTIYAVHRVWLLSPKQRRLERLSSRDPKARMITSGCINVDPSTYRQLVESNQTSLLITR